MQRRKTRWKALIAILVLIALAVVAFRFMHGTPAQRATAADQPATKRVPVTVVAATQQDVPIYLSATGTVQAQQTVTVQPLVGGRLLSVDFKAGQHVEKGDLLAEIDPSTYEATYQQDVARMHSDQARLATARSQLARSEKLVKQKYISSQDLDTQANTVKQLAATVAVDSAMVDSSKLQLGYTKVRAPISGLAGIREIDPGNVVTTSTAIVVLTHVHPVNVMFALPGNTIDQVRTAQAKAPLAVAVLDSTGAHVTVAGGVLKVIDNRINPDSGMYSLKSEFPNTDTKLWPGQFVNVRLTVATVHNGVVIPSQAVERGPDGDYVYVLQKDETVRMQPVTIADQADDTHVLVGKGLAAGDKVVTEGQFRLKPGSRVQPLKPGEVPATGGAGGTSTALAG